MQFAHSVMLQSVRPETLTVADAAIAAVALAHELTLMTDNVKDFPMKELALYPLRVA